MTIARRKKIVLLGMMGRMRVAGCVWQTLHYLVGLRRLGYEPYYVEAHGATPWAFQDREAEVAAFIGSILQRFDMGDRWAYHARGRSGRYYGLTGYQVGQLYESAAAILNLHGATVPTADQSATGRLVYIDTDPVRIQLDVYHGVQTTADVLEQHYALFTFGENYGNADCTLPVSDRFRFKPTRQPVVLDFWTFPGMGSEDVFTTIGNWENSWRDVEFNGEQYHWSKHFEFLKIIDIPSRTRQPIELALSKCKDDDQARLLSHGWRFRDALSFSNDLNAYREYIVRSKAEFTVAKDQNIRLRTGWFSDRSATYLAAGRPVVTQETGFSNILPTGQGLFAFSDMDEALASIYSINADYGHHRRAASEIAREYFAHDVVLTQLLSEAGVDRPMLSCTKRHHAGDISVNVVGAMGSDIGPTATVNGYVRGLQSIGVNVAQIDASNAAASFGDRSQKPPEAELNLICSEVAAYFSSRSCIGEDFFRDRYNIGVWVWESPNFLKQWYDRFVYYDEIWAPTSFIASALSPISPVPVIRMPYVLEPIACGSRSEGRRRLAIGDSEFVFLFVFNFYSRFQRKNPMAVIESFKRAFRPDESVHLVIKCGNAAFRLEHFRELNRNAEGHRISIYDGIWSADEISDLIAGCDCYVSLHRAEGVGLTISEAMAAGKPVVATGWSGNMDFMTVSNSFPVSYRLVELDEDVPPYRAGDVWAEPSVEHAAEILRYIFEHRDEAEKRGDLGRTDIRCGYSAEAVGALLSQRLKVISKQREFRSLKDAVRMPVADLDRFLSEFSGINEYVPEKELRYRQLKKELSHIVKAHLPPSATLVVVSKGDEELLNLGGFRAWHFPLHENFEYAGHYPRDNADAIRLLESTRAKGGDFLLFPKTAFWWFDHYAGFHEHLLTRYKVAHRDQSCVIFELR